MQSDTSRPDSGGLSLRERLGTMADGPHFVVYELRPQDDGSTDKVPVHHVLLTPVDSQDIANRITYAEARDMAHLHGPMYGVGFVIPDGCFFLDLDHARQGDTWQPYVTHFMGKFPNAYVEVSQSREGVHILGRYTGTRPLHRTRNRQFKAELYTGGRFCALTGTSATGFMETDLTDAFLQVMGEYFPVRSDPRLEGEWSTQPVAEWRGPVDDGELIRRAMAMQRASSKFGGRATFTQLWTADADALGRAYPPNNSGDAYDRSAADQALANHLAYWTGKDCKRMERLMRMSALVRPKWDREDYFKGRTILKAASECTRVYAEMPAPPPPLAPAPPPAAPPPPTDPAQLAAPPPPSAAVVAMPVHTLTTGSKNRIEATLPNLEQVLGGQRVWQIGYDEFRDRVMVAPVDTLEWRPVSDDDMIALRTRLEREQPFAPITPLLMHHALRLIGKRHSFDSAKVWLGSLVWDGMPRIAGFLRDYCGAEDSEYTRAVSRYIWSGLAARVLVPGCQLDMVVALQSPQGTGKSTGLQAMVPDPEFFTDGLSLHQDDDNFKRLLRGKLVVEIAELAGLSRADINVVKRTITRRIEEWIEKYQTLPTMFSRRCMFFASTNEERFLPPDETGNRRWLPVPVTRIDRERIAADRNQLWAEGAALYQLLGTPDYKDAELLANGQHGQYEAVDVWRDPIEQWLATPSVADGVPPGTRPFTITEVLAGALKLSNAQMDGRAEKRVSRVLRQLGYESRPVRVDGATKKRWVKV